MTRQILWLTSLLFFTAVLHAQDNHIQLRVESNIGYSDRFFINDGSVPETVVAIWEGIEKSKVAYSIGVLVELKLTKHLGIQAGGRYVDWGYQTDKTEFVSAVVFSQLPEFTETKSQNRYLEVPIRFGYNIPLGSSQLYFTGGWYPSFNVSNNMVIKRYFGSRVEVERTTDNSSQYPYRYVNMIGEFGFGIQKMFSEKLGFAIGPSVRTQTFGIRQDVPLNRAMFFYGLSAAILFQ